MKKELYAPVVRAIAALILIIMVKLVAIVTLGGAGGIYSAVNIALSLAVVIVLLRFRQEFNRELVISKPDFPEAQSFITGIVLLLGILIIYRTFAPYSDNLPYGAYNILFFVLALTPVYLLWSILNKNTHRLSELLLLSSSEREHTCSCGYENPGSAKFCSRCGSHLQ